jgi:hypothetical protein
MTTVRFTVAGVSMCLMLSGCSSNDYATSSSHVAVDGTMTANVIDYGPWSASQIATATSANGALTIVGKDVNAVQVRLFLIGIDLNTSQPDLVRQINLSPVSADTVGYLNCSEGTSGAQYGTQYPGGHGSVTFTHIGTDHVVGTFALTAYPPNPAFTPSSYTVISGAFDIKPKIGAP